MSSSSDIEKLFDHFGGDASAYQEIGRENEARSARTRWPLLVTLDLTQPTIPAIVQRREPGAETLAQEAARKAAEEAAPSEDRQDAVPKDAASVTRAKAPLFTRSHRRDIPPVVVAAAKSAAPRGASRFGAPETNDDGTAQASASSASAAPAAPAAAQLDAATPMVTQATSAATLPHVPHMPHVPPVASAPAPTAIPPAGIAPLAQFHTPAVPVTQPMTGTPPNVLAPRTAIPAVAPRAAVPAPLQAPAPTWVQTRIPAPDWTQTPAQAHAPMPAPAYTSAPTAPRPPASILGKLFAAQPAPAPQPPAANPGESAPLQSVFDRLRGTPAQTAAAPAGATRAVTPATSNSWLVNGPRRS
ncbi:cellulose biosynthesis protein BcsP [Paraburkholderia fungorum]|uniref:Cellulose biosynthesis protein BcsR n=1 Tax=Paraburkholderia fungorum TaxID=134537 RepID=A0A3R7F7E1_9BURK|nr:cellulose biosynthesis protein BcsP [Paraburkholderia fungorum]RKF44285.1 hypothetical protein BCY88_29600 [Paraburkholderia fungorum]